MVCNYLPCPWITSSDTALQKYTIAKIQYIPLNIHMTRSFLYFSMLRYWPILPLSYRIFFYCSYIWHSNDSPTANEATPENMAKSTWILCEIIIQPQQYIIKQNRGHILWDLLCTKFYSDFDIFVVLCFQDNIIMRSKSVRQWIAIILFVVVCMTLPGMQI